MNRDFKGIWIPREIWLRKDISALEKTLWAEIHSLYDKEKGGCYASNEYLQDFCGVQERRLSGMITNLKEKGLIEQVSFDGRKRVIKATLPSEEIEACNTESQKSATQGSNKVLVSGAIKCDPLIYRDISLDKRDRTPPIPQKGEATAVAKDSGISKEIKDETERFLSTIREFKADYIAPKKKDKLWQSMKKIRGERSIERILEVLGWAVKDTEVRGDWSGWSSKIVGSKNPVEYLYSKLNNLEIQCDTKPTRKYLPNSDDKKALEEFRKSKEQWND